MVGLAEYADLFQPPPQPETWLEFAKKVRLPDGPYAGQLWDPESEPVQAAFIQSLDSGVYRSFVMAICSQTGKSLMGIQVPALKFITQERLASAYILPSLEVLDRNWTEKIKPGIEGCGFESWLPVRGPGSKGGRPKAIRFSDPATGAQAGSLVFMAAGSGNTKETSLASSTVGATLIDEVDDFTDVNHVKLGLARAAAFGKKAWQFLACTVNKSENSIILWFYENSTRHKMVYPCPHCGEYQSYSPDQISYEGDTEAEVMGSARLACSECGVLLTEDERRNSLRSWRCIAEGQTVTPDGDILGPVPNVGAWGIRAGQLDFHIGLGIPELAREHWEATKAIESNDDHSAMRFYMQKRHSLQYTGEVAEDDQTQEISSKYLANKFKAHGFSEIINEKDELGSRYRAKEVPEDVTGGVLAVDVQGNRAYYSVTAYTDTKRTYQIAWGYQFGNSTRSEWASGELHATLDVIDEIASDLPVQITDRVVDTGFETKELIKYLREHEDWKGVRGVSSIPKQLLRRGGEGIIAFDTRWKPGLGRFDIVTNFAMGRVHGALMSDAASDSAMLLPAGMKANAAYLKHLCSWVFKSGKQAAGEKWVQIHKRNDHLDTAAYALAIIIWRKGQAEIDAQAQVIAEQAVDSSDPWGMGHGGSWSVGGGDWV